VLRRRLIPLLLLVLLGGGYAYDTSRDGGGGGTGGTTSALAAGSTHTAHVVRVVDGDTILVSVAGHEERVRYIGVDTPESVKPGVPVQCYAKAASHANDRMVAGRDVTLVTGAEARDRYGRLLAYVYRRSDHLFVNAELVRRGYARQMTIAPNTAMAPRFAALVRQARSAGRGLWSACAE
jgi:micrococcal nuclease